MLRGQRVAAALAGIGLALLLVSMLGRAFAGVTAVGLLKVNSTGGGNVANLGAHSSTPTTCFPSSSPRRC